MDDRMPEPVPRTLDLPTKDADHWKRVDASLQVATCWLMGALGRGGARCCAQPLL